MPENYEYQLAHPLNYAEARSAVADLRQDRTLRGLAAWAVYKVLLGIADDTDLAAASEDLCEAEIEPTKVGVWRVVEEARLAASKAVCR